MWLIAVTAAKAATVPLDFNAEANAVKFPYFQATQVFVWEENQETSTCRVGILAPVDALESDATIETNEATLLGRLMMITKPEDGQLGGNIRKTAPLPVAFTPIEGATCEKPPAPLCDCDLAFFVLGEETGSTSEEEFAAISAPFISRSAGLVPATGLPDNGSSGGSGGGGTGGSGSGGSSEDDDPPSDGDGSSGDDDLDVIDRLNLDLANGVFSDDHSTELLLEFARVTTEDGASIFVYDPDEFSSVPDTGAICGLEPGFWCTADLYFDFFFEVSDLQFEAFYFGGDDMITASIFDVDGFLTSFDITGNGLVDFTGFSGITRLVIADFSPQKEGSAGAAYGNFSFSLTDNSNGSTGGGGSGSGGSGNGDSGDEGSGDGSSGNGSGSGDGSGNGDGSGTGQGGDGVSAIPLPGSAWTMTVSIAILGFAFRQRRRRS